MDRLTAGEPWTVIGPAVIGSGQLLCWKPCCKEPVRLHDGEFERSLPLAIPCDRPRCQKRWTVQFPPTPPTEDAQAVWRLHRPARPDDPTSSTSIVQVWPGIPG